MVKRIGVAAAALIALGLLAGCAAQLPASPGLGGSDGGSDYVGIADPAANSSPSADEANLSIVPWALPHGFRMTFDASALPNGTTASLRLKDFNCMAEAFNGPIDLSQPKQFLVEIDQGTTCWFGTRPKSWITWTLAVTLPGGATKSTTFELAFTHQGGGIETSCWGENGLGCTAGPVPDFVREGDWKVNYLTQTLKLT
ncbi:MAG TPA: hypothetical protein VNQ52_09860 [Microbacteriaceae bacterium]|nr:hypothetical protein [Microbacteriaceae bacterium]